MAESEILRFLPPGAFPRAFLGGPAPVSLQEALGKFSLVPIVIGDQSFATCQKVGQAIGRSVKGKSVLLVASPDLSHFHPYDRAVKIDQVFLDDIRAFDPQKLSQNLEGGKRGGLRRRPR